MVNFVWYVKGKVNKRWWMYTSWRERKQATIIDKRTKVEDILMTSKNEKWTCVRHVMC